MMKGRNYGKNLRLKGSVQNERSSKAYAPFRTEKGMDQRPERALLFWREIV